MEEYKQYKSLEKMADDAKAAVLDGRKINFLLQGEFFVNAIREEPLLDVQELAQEWRAPVVPKKLFFNHGSFYKNGLEHIKDELARKPTSNRALYSLLDQNKISGSNDDPIPSFMIFQCAITEGILYCTAYFRALEVAQFLRINLEEIRLNLCDILDGVDVERVRVSVFAFNAYNIPDQIPLQRCKLDLMTALGMDDMYKRNPAEFAKVVADKAKQTTVVELNGLEAMREWLGADRKELVPPALAGALFSKSLDKAIEAAISLKTIRHQHSHSDKVEKASVKYVQTIERLVEELRK